MGLQMPRGCPGLARPIQSHSGAGALGATSITLLRLRRATSLPAATPNAGTEPSCQGSQQGPISNFIKLNIFWQNISISVSQQPRKVPVGCSEARGGCVGKGPRDTHLTWPRPSSMDTMLRRSHATNAPCVGCFPSSLFLVHQQKSSSKLSFQVKWNNMHQVETTEGFSPWLVHSSSYFPLCMLEQIILLSKLGPVTSLLYYPDC